ncbi:MAG: hypothetical protein IKD70_03840 [Eggerthellaceae bacterium]|nr:hypothetical protein [Eggerthellaceae bacterium]
MKVLVVPMFALSAMGGPWSRAQAIAAAAEAAGHHAVLAMSADGNCRNPRVADIHELPVPSPLGLPMAIASRTFPLAQKLGIAGRKPVGSFEEVLWLTGNLAYPFLRDSVAALRKAIRAHGVDALYSEFSLPAIIAAKAEGVPLFGSVSYPTQASYASTPAKAGGLRRLLAELGLPDVKSSLELLDWLDRRFVPSCPALEPFDDAKTRFVGFLEPPVQAEREAVPRDCVVIYLGSGSVPTGKVARTVREAFADFPMDVYVAGARETRDEGNLHFAPHFDFAELLPRAACFVNHGGQNSTMDALRYGAAQAIVPGRIFERRYNAGSIARAGAGIVLERFDATSLAEAVGRAATDNVMHARAEALHVELAELGGADAIVANLCSSSVR